MERKGWVERGVWKEGIVAGACGKRGLCGEIGVWEEGIV